MHRICKDRVLRHHRGQSLFKRSASTPVDDSILEFDEDATTEQGDAVLRVEDQFAIHAGDRQTLVR
ncbi:hypothetical protein D3C80_2005560 [compost metagenome]